MKPEERLEQVARRLNLSRQKLASGIGISLSSVAMMFTGANRLRKPNALACQAAFGISAAWLMSGKKPVFVRPGGAKLSDDALALAARYAQLKSPKLRAAAQKVLEGLQGLESAGVA